MISQSIKRMNSETITLHDSRSIKNLFGIIFFLHENSLRNHQFQGVDLGRLSNQMILRSARDVDIMSTALSRLREFAQEILKNKHRLQIDSYLRAVDNTLNPSKFDLHGSYPQNYGEDLKIVRDRLG